ncbi:MAG TPA: hypothetical protein VIN03_12090 [Roseateles sp.]
MTHAAQLIQAIRAAGRRGMTYLELELLRISSSPWKRLDPKERPERYLRRGESLKRQTGRDGLVRFVVVRG